MDDSKAVVYLNDRKKDPSEDEESKSVVYVNELKPKSSSIKYL